MSTGPVDDKIRAALERLGGENITPSPAFSEQVLNEVTSLAVKETKRMRQRSVVLRVLVILASVASIWMILSAGALAMLAGGILAIVFLPLGRYRASAAFCSIAVCCFVVSTFFNDGGAPSRRARVSVAAPDPKESSKPQGEAILAENKPSSVLFYMMVEKETVYPLLNPHQLKLLELSDETGKMKDAYDERLRYLAKDDTSSLGAEGERYGEAIENQRVSVAKEPLSTFSADVDTGSYTNMRRFVRQGQIPPPGSVRIEEYLNYFSFPCNSASDNVFSSCYEIAPSPFEEGRHLLKLTIKAKEMPTRDDVGWNLVFLVDVSGSMVESTKLPLVKESLKLLAQRMRPIDRVAIVTYAGAAGVALPSTPGSQRSAILSAIEALGAGGSTAGSAGIETAYQIASEHFIAGSVNRVVLATDGDFNVGVTSTDDLIRLIEAKRAKGITLTTLGFGQGNIREDIMEQLANKGNGNYFYIDSFQEARRALEDQFTANMQVVAKDVKLQVEFNPAHVAAYRLIGFDNRRLNAEDFTDDKKDAGEVGSGHTVTALYEVTLADSAKATELAGSRRYSPTQPTPVTVSSEHDSELGMLRVRYQSPEGGRSALIETPLLRSSILSSIEKGSDDYRFAVAVAGLGEHLRAGSYSSAMNLKTVLEIARGAIGSDPDGSRHEFVTLASDVERLRR